MDNRLPILKEAAMKALMAIQDNAIQAKIKPHSRYTKEDLAWVMDRKDQTGMTCEERLKEAHGLLQEALSLFYGAIQLGWNIKSGVCGMPTKRPQPAMMRFYHFILICIMLLRKQYHMSKNTRMVK